MAALAPTSGQDGAPGPSAHAQAETMRLGPPAIVGLERALTQGQLRCGSGWRWWHSGPTTRQSTRLQPRHGRPSTVRGCAERVKRQTCRNELVTVVGRRLEITLRKQEKRVLLESELPVDGTGQALLASAPHQRRHPPFMTCPRAGPAVPCRAQPVDKAVGSGRRGRCWTFHAAGGNFVGLPVCPV